MDTANFYNQYFDTNYAVAPDQQSYYQAPVSSNQLYSSYCDTNSWSSNSSGLGSEAYSGDYAVYSEQTNNPNATSSSPSCNTNTSQDPYQIADASTDHRGSFSSASSDSAASPGPSECQKKKTKKQKEQELELEEKWLQSEIVTLRKNQQRYEHYLDFLKQRVDSLLCSQPPM